MPKKATKKVSKDVQKLKRDVRLLKSSNETKHHDENYPGGFIDFSTNHVTTLLDPGQSITNQTRIGNEISPFHLRIRGTVDWNPVSGAPQLVRILVIQSKQRFVPVTNTNTISTGVLILSGTSQAPISDFNYENRKKFTVLHDRQYMVSEDDQSQPINVSKRIKRKLVFQEGGSTTAERGQIYMLIYSDQASASSSKPVVRAYSRIQYKD